VSGGVSEVVTFFILKIIVLMGEGEGEGSDCAPKNVVPNDVVANALLPSDVPAKKLARQLDFTGFGGMPPQSPVVLPLQPSASVRVG